MEKIYTEGEEEADNTDINRQYNRMQVRGSRKGISSKSEGVKVNMNLENWQSKH